jgi:long-chain acyl-CoA synthetase
MMNVHMPAIEQRIIPEMDRKLKKEPTALAPHATLVSLVDEMAERHDLASPCSDDGRRADATSFRDLKLRADRGGTAGGAGREEGGARRPGGAQPPRLGRSRTSASCARARRRCRWIRRWMRRPGPQRAHGERRARRRVGRHGQGPRATSPRRTGTSPQLDVHAVAEEDDALAAPAVDVEPGDVASLIYTSGTTGRPKGVMLTHANFTSLVAALAPIFPLSRGDAVLSVLPLHHTFEFTCGLLLPLSRGARVVYLDELTGDSIAKGLASLARDGDGGRAGALAAARTAHPAAGRRARSRRARRVRRGGRGEPLALGERRRRRGAGALRRGAREDGRHVKWLISEGPRCRARRRSASRASG